MIKITIPFSGFYESWHNENLKNAFDSIFQDDHGLMPEKVIRAYNACDSKIKWRQAQNEYSREYVEALNHFLGESLLAFDSLESPREYNFTSDRIFCEISRENLIKAYKATPAVMLQTVISDQFTSCDGFISFYPDHLDSWDIEPRLVAGEGKPLDHNEAGAVIHAYLATRYYSHRIKGSPDSENEAQKACDDCCEWLDSYLCEDFMGSGVLENIIWSAIPEKARKLANFANDIARQS